MTVLDACEFLIREPASDYHRQAREYLSSHQLADFRRCPLLYFRKKAGLVGDGDRPAYLIGRAAHVLILEGRPRFWEEYEVGGPINPRTREPYGVNTKAFADWQATHGKPVLTNSQYDLLAHMDLGVRQHAVVGELLSEGVAEGVVRTDYCGVACQIRMDWLNPHRGIVDLKTCEDLTWFEADARRHAYAHQLAFYRAVLAQVIGVSMPVHFLAVEKREPFRCGVWRISDDTLSLAQQENEAAIDRLRQCEAASRWPTGYEEVRLFDAA